VLAIMTMHHSVELTVTVGSRDSYAADRHV